MDGGNGIAVDALGYAFVTGDTQSTNFPLASARQASRAGGRDAFVTRIGELPTVQFTSSTYSVAESGTTATITVTLTTAWPVTATVGYTTSNGTATSGSDYTAATGTLTFAPGSLSQTFGVPITNDVLDEANETVNLMLNSPVSATLGTPYTATLTILDDENGDVITYTYDSLYRLTRAGYGDGRSYAYDYDAVGNILTKTVCTGSGCTPAVTSYVYDNANRLTSVGGVSSTWDNNGNLLTDGVLTYTYDAANRLITVTNGITATGFTYNGLGDRVRQNVDGAVLTYTLDLNARLTQVLVETSGIVTTTYLYGVGRIAQQTGVNVEYFLTDALGSVRQLVDTSRIVTLQKSYEPYGNTLSSTGTGVSRYDFTGEYKDPSGQLYLRARYYSPYRGRFIQKDVFAGEHVRPLTLNRWGYVAGNPVNYIDPSGHSGLNSGRSLGLDCPIGLA